MPKGTPARGLPTAMQHFCAKVRLPTNDTGCWEWTGIPNHDGYGRFSVRLGMRRRRVVMAHRFAYEAFVGKMPEGHECDHLCKNRRCVNPSHLRAATHAENMRSRDLTNVVAVKARITHCPQGHEYSPENTYRRPGGKGRDCLACRRAASARTAARRKRERALARRTA